jgi:hypothetical protein
MDMKIPGSYLKMRTLVIASVTLLSMSASNVDADGVNDMCVDSAEICECAARKLKTEVGDKAYALYEAIGSVYLVNKNTDMNMVEAWDAAVKSAANKRGESFIDTLSETNTIGSAHREAIETCKAG